MHNTMGEQLAEGPGSKGSSKGGYNRLATSWGSTSGPVLFNVFIYDLHAGHKCMLTKLAGDTKLGSWKSCLLPQGWRGLANWRAGKSPTIRSLTRASAGFSTWEGATLDACTDWGTRGRRAAPLKGVWGLSLNMSQQQALSDRRASLILQSIRHSTARQLREGIALLCSGAASS